MTLRNVSMQVEGMEQGMCGGLSSCHSMGILCVCRDVPARLVIHLGVAPPSFLFIRAGTTLYQMTSATGHLSWTSIIILGFFAIVSLLPVVFKHTLAKKLT